MKELRDEICARGVTVKTKFISLHSLVSTLHMFYFVRRINIWWGRLQLSLNHEMVVIHCVSFLHFLS